jgi:signal transduction histidine kinase
VILLDNSRKYTKSGGAVLLRLDASPLDAPGAAQIEVIDTGIGIDPVDRPHIFDRFYRGAVARQQSGDGSGLGLAIAHTIVERHGGTITVGEGPGGRGCTARIVLPD